MLLAPDGGAKKPLHPNEVWVIGAGEQAKHYAQFAQLNPNPLGFLSGEQAKNFFLQSGLPPPILGQIWRLADIGADGQMDRREFSIAMHLIRITLHGYSLPPTLPATLLLPAAPSAAPVAFVPPYPVSMIGGMGMPRPGLSPGFGGAGFSGTLPASISMSFPPNFSSMPAFSASLIPMGSSTTLRPLEPTKIGTLPVGTIIPTQFSSGGRGSWEISPAQKQKYCKMFDEAPCAVKSRLSGSEAKEVFARSGLSQGKLAEIWNLADLDGDGHLTLDEFCIAMCLTDAAKSGRPLPSVLPAELRPPTPLTPRKPLEGASPIFDGGGGGVSKATKASSGMAAVGSFEDRRRENFTKGQAELERRQDALKEQQRRETEEQRAFERAEAERVERARLEQEERKQARFENQMAAQRRAEEQRDAERRRDLERREAARRQLERSRAEEWEMQRHAKLSAERHGELTQVERLRAEVFKLDADQATLNKRRAELTLRLETARREVGESAGAIEDMKGARDAKLARIDQLQVEYDDWSRKLAQSRSQRSTLAPPGPSGPPGPPNEAHREATEAKQRALANVARLRARLNEIRVVNAAHKQSVDTLTAKLKTLRSEVREYEGEKRRLERTLAERQTEVEKQAKVVEEKRKKERGGATGNFSTADITSRGPVGGASATRGGSFAAFGGNSAVGLGETASPISNGSIPNAARAKEERRKEEMEKKKEKQSDSAERDDMQIGADRKGFGGVRWTPQTHGLNEAILREGGAAAPPGRRTASRTPSGDVPAPPGSNSVNTATPGGEYPVDTAMHEHRKFVAIFPFEARESDELTIAAGDVIWVGPDQSDLAEGWLYGWRGADPDSGQSGLFPESYARPADAAEIVEGIYDVVANGNEFEASDSFETLTTALSNASLPGVTTAAGAGKWIGETVKQAEYEPAATDPSARLSLKPATSLYIALYPYESSEPSDLTFEPGEIITVTRADSDWWTGTIADSNGNCGTRSGDFPSTYVLRMEEYCGTSDRVTGAGSEREKERKPGKTAVVARAMERGLVQSGDIAAVGAEKPGPMRDMGKTDADRGVGSGGRSRTEIATAIAAFTATGPGQISLAEGQQVRVRAKGNGGWWEGEVLGGGGAGGLRGWFPANHVKIVDSKIPLGGRDESPGREWTSLPVFATSALESRTSASLRRANSPHGSPVGSTTPGRGSATLSRDFVTPTTTIKGQGEFGGARNSAFHSAKPERGVNGTQSIASTPANPIAASLRGSAHTPTKDPPTPAVAMDTVMAIYAYAAQHDDELSFPKGAVITVIDRDEGSGWWRGELGGSVGLIPVNYVVEEQSGSTPRENSATPEAGGVSGLSGGAATQVGIQAQGYQQSPAGILWSKDAAVIAMTSETERKRQNHIHELIQTEETYTKDLQTGIDVFYKPLMTDKVLAEEELTTIFINWQELRVCNMKLMKALRVRRKMCGGEGQVVGTVGDILVENLAHMTPYVRFCSCQLSSAALLQRKSETDERFREVHKRCYQSHAARTGGMPLSSFLLKPMQRITKYPLLIGKILEYTPPDHPDHQNTKDALAKATELCNQVNEGVREKENSDRLEWIQARVHCDGLTERITFNSVTNCLGPRKYIHGGILYKAKSNKELVGLLFNDFLLLAQPQRPLPASTPSIFNLDPRYTFKLYRTPIFLNDLMVDRTGDTGEASESAAVFHLSQLEHKYSLRASSAGERDGWVRRIEAASRHYLDTEVRRKREKAALAKQSSAMIGRLFVVIVEATNLIARRDGKSDPYCEVSMGAQEHRTKVAQNSLNPKWNATMQFSVKDPGEDVLCITVYDRDLFSPNDFLGRTEVRLSEVARQTRASKGPISTRLVLHEVESGEVSVKLDLQLFDAH